jgi:hypothetical protein
MTDLRQAAQAVLNAWNDREGMFEFSLVIEDLDKALEQPEQVDCPRCGHVCSQRPWQGLDDYKDWDEIDNKRGTTLDTFADGAAWAGAKLKERNNG